MHKKFKYNLAISYSTAQETIAHALYQAIKNLGMEKVYCKPYQEEENLGKNLTTKLGTLYDKSSRMVLAILSQEYFKGKHTLIELKAISARLERETDFFIPVLFKNPELPENLKDLAYIKWRSNPEVIANIIYKRYKAQSKKEEDPIHIIKIDRRKHSSFLADQRKDPISKDIISTGDEVVVCKSCKTVFLKDVWMQTLQGMHCGQRKTLKELPLPYHLLKRFVLSDALNEINDIIASLHFRIYCMESIFSFEKVFCFKDCLILEKPLGPDAIKVVAKFKYLNLSGHQSVCASPGVYTFHLKSNFGEEGILLNLDPLKEIVIAISPNKRERAQGMVKTFDHLLLNIITECQNFKS